MKCCWIEVSAVRPNQCVHLSVNPYSIEESQILERTIKFSRQYRLKVDDLLGVVIEPHFESIGPYNLEGVNSMDGMTHSPILLFQWLNRQRPFPLL
jgi:hypothetical protein